MLLCYYRMKKMKIKKIFMLFAVAFSMFVSCANAASPSKVNEITQEQFKLKVGEYSKGFAGFKMLSEKPVVVDIYATWCGPCRRLSPIIEELSKEYSGKIDFYKIDLDKNRALGDAFGVQSIPMLIFFPVNGKPQYIMGLYPKNELKEVIDYMFFKKK